MTSRDDRSARRAKVVMALLALVAFMGRPALALDPLGSEFQVNTYTTGTQGGTLAVAADPAGNFVVVWEGYSYDNYPDAWSVFGQRFDANGAPLGSEFQVNTYTTNEQGVGALAVATDAAGNFVVVWGGYGAGDDDDEGVFGRRFDSSGNPTTGEFVVNSSR
jgi:hypothetical protein